MGRGTVWLVQRLSFDPGQNTWLMGDLQRDFTPGLAAQRLVEMFIYI